jgi:hypothetical protein
MAKNIHDGPNVLLLEFQLTVFLRQNILHIEKAIKDILTRIRKQYRITMRFTWIAEILCRLRVSC